MDLKKLIVCTMLCSCFPALSTAQSLFHSAKYQDLVSDRTAIGIGDSLTVLIVENSKAESETDQRNDRKSNVSIDASLDDNAHSAALGFGNNYENGGQVTRSGNLLGRVSVTVTGVLPSGNFRIEGKQSIRINREEQVITIHGFVRPKDILPDNFIYSYRISDARISYDGQGPLGREKPQGIIMRVINWFF